MHLQPTRLLSESSFIPPGPVVGLTGPVCWAGLLPQYQSCKVPHHPFLKPAIEQWPGQERLACIGPQSQSLIPDSLRAAG